MIGLEGWVNRPQTAQWDAWAARANVLPLGALGESKMKPTRLKTDKGNK